jgi:ferric-dicitrate binding protein FerR (iron transport regulator)
MSARDDLVLLALGRLEPREREALLLRVKADPALAGEAREIAAHLALYDRLPAPPEPAPFEALLPRLHARPRAAFGWWRVAAAALVLLGAGALLFPSKLGDLRDDVRAPVLRAGALEATGALEERRLDGGRVRVVLDAAAAFADDGGSTVRLERGRAWFEVGPGPFTVRTPRGDVEVVGTAFEVELAPQGDLRVEVGEGRVRVHGESLAAGEGWAGGARHALTSPPGRFARLAEMRLVGGVVSARGLAATLVFDNPARFPRHVPGPEAAARGLLLALEGPDGARHSQGVDVLALAGGRIPPAGRLTLRPGERLEVPLEIARPPGPAGSWRLTALYRPQGEAPISSAPWTFEMPPSRETPR